MNMYLPILLADVKTWFNSMWYPPIYLAATTAVLILLLLLTRIAFPKLYALIWVTAKEGMNQTLFTALLGLGIALLLFLPYIPFNTLGEDLKMHMSVGLTFIKIPALLLAIWLSGVSISEEIEGKTALMLLSKPVSRVQLILGKFFGILVPVFIMYIVLGGLFLGTTGYKVVHNARESCEEEPKTQDCVNAMVNITPGIAMNFMETATMTAVAVALSTRLPMLANIITCLSVFLLGHLIQYLPQYISQLTHGKYVIVDFITNVMAAILPVLGHFSIESSIGANQTLPWVYIGASSLYCVLYCCAAMVVALFMFEDRDLA